MIGKRTPTSFLLLVLVFFLLPPLQILASQTVTLEGVVLNSADKSPLAGAEVVIRDEVVTTGPDGAFRFENLPVMAPVFFQAFRPLPKIDKKDKKERFEYQNVTQQTPFALVWVKSDLKEGTGSQPGATLCCGWRVVDLSGLDGRLEISVSPKDSQGKFCRECHLDNPYLSKVLVETKTPWEVTVTGELFSSHRFRDLHPTDFDYKTAAAKSKDYDRSPRGVDMVDGRKVTCFTCHNPHLPGEFRAYVKGEFEAAGEFCRRCHL